MGKTIDKVSKEVLAQVPPQWYLGRPLLLGLRGEHLIGSTGNALNWRALYCMVEGRYEGLKRGPKFRVGHTLGPKHWFDTAAAAIAYWELSGLGD